MTKELATRMGSSNISFESYDASVEDWSSYVERLESYFVVNGIEDKMKVPAILSLMGATTYKLLKNLATPNIPSELTYQDIVKLLSEHLNPKPLEMTERFRFYKRKQFEGESIANYCAELQKLSIHCNFGNNLSTMLRDKLVMGLKNENIQKKLLTEDKLTYEKARSIAFAMESAQRDVCEIQNQMVSIKKLHSSQDKTIKDFSKFKKSESTKKFDKSRKCYRCDSTQHLAHECKHKNTQCRNCLKNGHLAKVCRSKRNETVKQIESCSETVPVNSVKSPRHARDKILLEIFVEGNKCLFELDTGADISCMNVNEFKKLCPDVAIKPTKLLLRNFDNSMITSAGQAVVQIQYKDQINTETIYLVHAKYEKIFSPGIGKLEKFCCRLQMKPNYKPVFFKPRPVPFALKERIETELKRLVAEDIIEPMTYSEWATPIVPVIKQNGNLRICGDYKVTINPGLKIEQYPLPRIEDIFAELSGGEFFTKIDLSEAYLQMLVDERDRHLLTINTHKGLFRYKRMNYGIALAPAVWQRAIEQVLSGIAGVHVFLNDITVTGRNDQEHFERLELVLQRLEEYGLRVNKRKSEFFKKSVNYCGHTIDKFGLHKTQEKIDAITKVPVPKTVSDLKSFLGLVNYYGKFIPNLSTRVAPFNNLLQKGTKFLWTAECEKAFKALKQEIASDRILCHYDPKLPLVLQTDASPVGIGAVLSHIMPDGSEKPAMFASRSLTKTERNYSQIDKEALSIVWGVKRFYQYLFGRHFDLVTDHKPLVSIFAPNRSLPCLSATRMVHYAFFLQAFSYTIKYRNTKNHGNADALSRLPLTVDKDCEYLTEADVTNISQVELMPVTATNIARATKTDRKLFELYESLKSGTELPVPWKGRESEFSLQNGCIMYGHRVCIPEKYQNQVLEELHVGHPGIVKMKALARSYCYWQGIDASIANFVQNCSACIATRNEPARINRHPWEWPNGPWQRIHVDYSGPFMGKMFFVVSDAYSKWIEVIPMKNITAIFTIHHLRILFAHYGIPLTLVSDNGASFTSYEFRHFLKLNNIKHITSAPYHPASNRQAERIVQLFKASLKSSRGDSGDLNVKLQRFLLQYRITPHSLTGETPSALFLKRCIRTRLDLFKPNLRDKVVQKQSSRLHTESILREFQEGEKVAVRNYSGPNKWKIGTIINRDGTLSYSIQVGNEIWKRHVDQIRKCGKSIELSQADTEIPIYDKELNFSDEPVSDDVAESEPPAPVPEVVPEPKDVPVSATPSDDMPPSPVPDASGKPKTDVPLRRSNRIRRPPERLVL
ncbi:uncharacterized protein K02A2.6-like [Argiope bruennichi]|uniref:uncharacterized protein K02A2.6-like n=1 Tax=Argiope bruennichi TaxID=94029 RepID=UPI00249529FA|nr:uncharacterized protein K02A2.6-like [Argiope bruennichi]